MKVEYINPFLKSIDNAMKTMLDLTPVGGAPFVKKDNATSGDVSGLIGFAAKNCKGAVALSFPTKTAIKVFNTMMGGSMDQVTKITPDVQDAIGELANIVAGGAKSELAQTGLTFNLAIPTVVLGKNHRIIQEGDTPVIVVPLKIDGLSFSMEICMKIYQRQGKKANARV